MNLDYCISSSSNDPFQDYLGQKAIILDDLRDKSFELEYTLRENGKQCRKEMVCSKYLFRS